MTYEVELKFPLLSTASVLARLDELNAQPHEPVTQYDRYFSHPQRDFAQTDEALRIRTVDERSAVTYKGPLADKRTKTRREIEVPLQDGPDHARRFGDLLRALGFREFATVRKRRIVYHLDWEAWPLELALDEVDQLGTFLEIEILAEDEQRDAACDSILRLAERLGLENSERKSYLCLLLEQSDSRET